MPGDGVLMCDQGQLGLVRPPAQKTMNCCVSCPELLAVPLVVSTMPCNVYTSSHHSNSVNLQEFGAFSIN